MTKIEAMAREAGLGWLWDYPSHASYVARFHALARAEALEWAAKVAELELSVENPRGIPAAIRAAKGAP